jgi:ankyrin repeat protein
MLVEKGASPNTVGRGGESALMFAASGGHVTVLTYLLGVGADVDGTDADGNTALLFATQGNQAQSVTTLLTHGASLSHVNHNGDTAFEVAVAKNLQAAQYAIENYLKDIIESQSYKVSGLGLGAPSGFVLGI